MAVLCRCNECIAGSVDDPTSPSGRRAGSMVSKRVFERHQRDQADRDRKAEQVLQGSIVSATFSSNQEDTTYSLPTRASDIHDAAQLESDPPRSQQQSSLPKPQPDLQRLNRELEQLQSSLNLRIQRFNVQRAALVFKTAPSSISDPVPPSVFDHPENIIYRLYDEWLWNTLDSISALEGGGAEGEASIAGKCRDMKQQIQKQFDILENIKLQAWGEAIVKAGLRGPQLSTAQKAQMLSPILVKTDHLFQPLARLPSQLFMQALLFTIVGLHVLSAVSRVDIEAMLAAVRIAVVGAVAFNHFHPNPNHVRSIQNELLSHIPKSLANLLERFEISPQITEYACCPKCFAIYRPVSSDPAGMYPESCTWKDLPNQDPCGATLVITSGMGVNRTMKPHRVYGYQDPVSWLGRLLSRPDIEAQLERSWTPSPGGQVKDIFDADVLRNFKGPDGKTPWSQCPNDELHLVFSLFVDWFNPYGNKQSGKSNSVGAIYMVCLSLPAAIRYKPENVYLVSIIPGPKEPSVTQLNHLLEPLVADFVKLWNSGVNFSRTAAKRYGRTIKCAIGPVVCDLPALRKTTGFAGHAATNFCSACRVKKADIADNFNSEQWPRRGWAEHVHAARQWRDASSQSQRDKIFERHGLRWSVLLNLPYWDPTRFTVIDSMHNLFLGEFQHHCRRVWGIEIKATKKKNIPHPPERQEEELSKGLRAIHRGSKSGLMKLRKGYIIALAKVNGVSVAGTKLRSREYAQVIIDWRAANPNLELKAPPVMAQPASEFVLEDDEDETSVPDISTFSVLDLELLQKIQSDIRATILPSWMEYPPRNFGSPSHGKLKADQWRTVCSVNLIITLIRIWGIPSASEREKAWLENYIDMVIAAIWVTRWSTSPERIGIFGRHMKRYLVNVKDLFGEDIIVPNHHLSLHLIECLKSFGPVHSWWTFPFERYNGMLRHLKTNNKPGNCIYIDNPSDC
ncbi:hypothetical protein Hypma_009877 [Hypsizygus marmoreus]|uniref:DUF4218 domain-containing protein n=1 Tax=Hypsizygus marmoreus TaxID=39966 RepID=A0A369JRS8_HYPMA|nr:hypothetical protein Hypma_009877 [Hypsizygus marmoreus]